MKSGDHVQNISEFTFYFSECLKHFSFSSYLLVTLHLPWPLMDGEASKANKMSSTHPNSNPSDVMDSMSQGKHIRKDPFLYFEFNQL